MAIVIKKEVSFDFLGEDYKNAYLTFQSIPLKDFDEITKSINEAQEKGTSGTFILDVLKKYFVEGEFPGLEKVEADDLDGLDQESVLKCFTIFTGQEILREDGTEVAGVADLKEASKTQSSTVDAGPQT